MMAAPARDREGGLVIVRLSQVPVELRRQVADTIIEKGRLRGVEALALATAAVTPRQDPRLRVDEQKAARVLCERRLPVGEMPKVWTW